MADNNNNNGGSYAVSSLLTSSLRCLVRDVTLYQDDVHKLPPHLKNKLLNLSSKRGLVTDDIIDKLTDTWTQVLDLSDSDVTDIALQKLGPCKNLRKLDLNSAKKFRTEVTSRGLTAVASSCPLLQVIYLRRCLNIADVGVIALTSGCRQLAELNIGGCVLITDAVLVAVSQNCHVLRSFNFSKTKVTDNGVISLSMGACKQSLIEVHMNNCLHLTNDAVEAVVQFCPNLAIFIFHGCPSITDYSRLVLDDLQSPRSNMKQVTWTIY